MTNFNLSLLVFVLVFSKKSMAAPDGGSSQTVLYDELLLVLQWPNSFCSIIYCDHPIPLSFTLHGLWLNMNSERVNCRPSSSNTIGLSPQISSDLRREMNAFWPNLLNQNYPEYFWLREYAKHGSCIPEFQNQVKYFQTAITFAKAIGIDEVMDMRLSSGLALQMGQVYEVTDFDNVTIAGATFYPSLRCNKADGGRYPQLREIVFCRDINNIQKSCTPPNRMVCSGQFEFPQVPAFLTSLPFPSSTELFPTSTAIKCNT